jgi:hypothetical protein
MIDIDDVYKTPDEYIQRYIDKIKEAENYTIPRWYKQPNYVEIWLEKDAVVSMFESMLRDREVRIVPNRGWTSATFVAKNIVRLWNKRNEEGIKHVYVLYAGDYDPSGLKMDDILKNEIFKKFSKYSIEGIEQTKEIKEENRTKVLNYLLSTIHFERIAITKLQIEEFNLQHLTDPDAKTLEKLEGNSEKKGDSNTEWFKLKHGDGRVYQIELDAMHAQREQFKEFLLSTMDQYFDEQIYERVVKQPQEQIRRTNTALANQMIKEQFPLEEDRDTVD